MWVREHDILYNQQIFNPAEYGQPIYRYVVFTTVLRVGIL